MHTCVYKLTEEEFQFCVASVAKVKVVNDQY